MSNLRKVIVPALHRLVLARHYAGARELLEAVFSNIEPHEASEQQMNHGIDAEDVNLLILAVSYRPGWKANLPGAASTILNVQEIPSRQGLASLQALLLKKILYSPLEYPANLDTVRLFLWQAAYIDLDMLRDILTLLKRVSQQATSSDDTLSDVSHNPVVPDAEMMHNIMQVYAKHGQHNVAEKWMKVILDAEDSSRREPQSGRRRTSSRRNAKTNSVSDRVQSDGSPSQSFPYWLPLRNEAGQYTTTRLSYTLSHLTVTLYHGLAIQRGRIYQSYSGQRTCLRSRACQATEARSTRRRLFESSRKS